MSRHPLTEEVLYQPQGLQPSTPKRIPTPCMQAICNLNLFGPSYSSDLCIKVEQELNLNDAQRHKKVNCAGLHPSRAGCVES